MRKLAVIFICSALCGSPRAAVDDIYTLILNGELAAAADSLSAASTASLRDGDMLLCAAMLEPDGDKSAQMYEAALNASVSHARRELVYYRLAQYYLATRDFEKLRKLIGEYDTIWETGKYRKHMQRFAAVAREGLSDYEAALRETDRYLLLFGEGEAAQWGKIDKGRLMLAHNKRIGADNVLRSLSRQKKGPGAPQALYLLALEAIGRRRTDDAVFYYNLLREGYPSAIGLAALIERMGDLSPSDADDNTAELRTGTFYSVQVGVFREKENARRQADLFQKYDKHIDIKSKKISNASYRVVYVGHFADYQSAEALKKKLEAEYNEVFQVVAR